MKCLHWHWCVAARVNVNSLYKQRANRIDYYIVECAVWMRTWNRCSHRRTIVCMSFSQSLSHSLSDVFFLWTWAVVVLCVAFRFENIDKCKLFPRKWMNEQTFVNEYTLVPPAMVLPVSKSERVKWKTWKESWVIESMEEPKYSGSLPKCRLNIEANAKKAAKPYSGQHRRSQKQQTLSPRPNRTQHKCGQTKYKITVSWGRTSNAELYSNAIGVLLRFPTKRNEHRICEMCTSLIPARAITAATVSRN